MRQSAEVSTLVNFEHNQCQNSVDTHKQKGKTLSSTHQPNIIVIALIVVVEIAVAEVDKPRIATTASTRRGRPKPKVSVRKIVSINEEADIKRLIDCACFGY